LLAFDHEKVIHGNHSILVDPAGLQNVGGCQILLFGQESILLD